MNCFWLFAMYYYGETHFSILKCEFFSNFTDFPTFQRSLHFYWYFLCWKNFLFHEAWTKWVNNKVSWLLEFIFIHSLVFLYLSVFKSRPKGGWMKVFFLSILKSNNSTLEEVEEGKTFNESSLVHKPNFHTSWRTIELQLITLCCVRRILDSSKYETSNFLSDI